MGDNPRVRIPLLEGPIRAGLSAASFGDRELNSQERDLLVKIFGDSIDLDPVRIAYTKLIGGGTLAYTMGNKILIHQSTKLSAVMLNAELTCGLSQENAGPSTASAVADSTQNDNSLLT